MDTANLFHSILPFMKRRPVSVTTGVMGYRDYTPEPEAIGELRKGQSYFSRVSRDMGELILEKNQNRLLLVSDERPSIPRRVAMIAGVYLYRQWINQTGEDEEYEYEDEDEYEEYDDPEEEEDSSWGVLEMSAEALIREKSPENPGNTLLQLCAEYGTGQVLYLTKLRTDCLSEELIRSIAFLSDKIMGTILTVTPELMKNQWIQELVYQGAFAVYHLPKLPADYDQKLFELIRQRLYSSGELTGEAMADKTMIDKSMADKSIEKLKLLRGNLLSEEDIPIYLCKKEYGIASKKPEKGLEEMVGVKDLKKAARMIKAMHREKLRNPLYKGKYGNALFVGKPGTGKSTGTQKFIKELTYAGVCSGNIVTATRADLIGSYLGHTAPKVAALFEKARGGILFIDEAGFLNQAHNANNSFCQECIKELVRYMENCRDVIVVFAMYESEMADFLRLDAGLTSRINHVLRFPDFEDDELQKIGEGILAEQGFRLMPEARREMMSALHKLKADTRREFGNARDVRCLVENAMSIRALKNDAEPNKAKDSICLSDMREAAENLLKEVSEKKPYGFRNNKERKSNYEHRKNEAVGLC